ncbi:MAG: hypothetical protein CL610_24135 [Anaerolineaceae bacterium]|nr:hypothetical protein [Anaerolineaceae bacterium]
MSTPDLHTHVKTLKTRMERAWPSIRKGGSDEQRQLLGAMYDSLTLAERLYIFPPTDPQQNWDQWRHDVIRPLSLCINSAELLLTDEDPPLTDEQRHDIQAVFDQAIALSRTIDNLYAQRATYMR